MLEAKDLPRCALSDFIEAQLRETVTLDAKLRAKKSGLDDSQVSLLQMQTSEAMLLRAFAAFCSGSTGNFK